MDTSEKYIKMCGAADEIQAMRAPAPPSNQYRFDVGDWFATLDRRADYRDEKYVVEILGTITEQPELSSSTPEEIDIETGGYNEGGGYYPKKIIWLPRLDQLIELVAAANLLSIIVDSEKALSMLGNHLIKPKSKSKEILWLELFMYYVHKKAWNGEKWS